MTAVREQGLYIFYSDLSWQVVYDNLRTGSAVKKKKRNSETSISKRYTWSRYVKGQSCMACTIRVEKKERETCLSVTLVLKLSRLKRLGIDVILLTRASKEFLNKKRDLVRRLIHLKARSKSIVKVNRLFF